MTTKRKLKNKIEDLEGGEEGLKDLEISIGSGPDKWAKKFNTGDLSGGENDEQT